MPKKVGLFGALVLSMGSIITPSLFFIPGLILSIAGEAGYWHFIIGAIIAFFMALPFIELSNILEKSGGPALFAKQAFGGFVGFIAGWATWVSSSIAIGAVAVGISHYFFFIFPLSQLDRILLSAGMIILFSAVNYFGISIGTKVETFLLLFTLSFLLIFIFYSAPIIKPIQFQTLSIMPLVIIFSIELFVGWETITISAEEIKNPRQTIPLALGLTVFILSLIYIFLFFTFFATISAEEISSSTNPLATAAGKNIGAQWTGIFNIGAIIIGITALNSWILLVARLPYTMAKQRQFLQWFNHTNRYNAPDRALLIQLIFGIAIALSGSYEAALILFMSVELIVYLICYFSLLKLRKIPHALKFPKLVTIVAILSTAAMFVSITPWFIMASIVLILLGIPSYVSIKLTTDKRFVEKFFDTAGIIFNFYVSSMLLKDRVEKILRLAEIKKNDTVLDFGCGSGTLTAKIAQYAKRVVALDISEKQLSSAIENTCTRLGLRNIIFVHSRKMPFKQTFDKVVSSLTINYLTNPEKNIEAIHHIIKKRGVVVFLGVRAPFIPHRRFLGHDQTIASLFIRAGFKDVRIKREGKGIIKYIYIMAHK